jgi:hypothetical protein
MIRRYPNGATRYVEDVSSRSNAGGKPGELKHLITRRKIKQVSDSVSSGERKRNSPNHRNHGFCGVVGLHLETNLKQKFLESYTKEGESPVSRNDWGRAVS